MRPTASAVHDLRGNEQLEQSESWLAVCRAGLPATRTTGAGHERAEGCCAAKLRCGERILMERSIWTEANDGSTVTLFACAICGASVQRQDKETHETWHRKREQSSKMR